MLADVTWENATLAAAFLLGAALGSLATIRIMRVVSDTFRKERRKDEQSYNTKEK